VDAKLRIHPNAHISGGVILEHVSGTRFGESRMDGFNMVALLLPGVAVTYYGEEIGMLNTDIPFNQTVGMGKVDTQIFSFLCNFKYQEA
jgi:glycosidase